MILIFLIILDHRGSQASALPTSPVWIPDAAGQPGA